MKELFRGMHYASVDRYRIKAQRVVAQDQRQGQGGRLFPVFNVPEPKKSSLEAIKFICTHTKKFSFQSETILSC